MEMLLTGIGLFLFTIMWKKMWVPTFLDTFRDHLFDLRDTELHNFFKEKYSLDNRYYIELRNLTNSYLRFTENISVWEYLFLFNDFEYAKKNKGIKLINKRFQSDNKELSEFINTYRRKCSSIVVRYMVVSSLLFILLIPIALLIILLLLFISSIFSFAKWISSNSLLRQPLNTFNHENLELISLLEKVPSKI